MTAAFKMASPGELCTHTKKLMAFCQTEGKSIKAMKRFIGVTDTFMQQLLAGMLEQKLIWRQSNGMYKTTQNKLHLIEEYAANSTGDLLALATAPVEPTPEQAEEVIELDLPEPANFAQANEFASKAFDMDAMAAEFDSEQAKADQHVVDNIDAKQRALNYCSMLLSPTSTELRRCLDELQMDLAVIRLNQGMRHV
ncbi:hypothetical protein [Alishewanella sp. HL-SH06]|uniref:hypothetical protein n=1 Tax=Alishewanella sp. HL-SH06 TaxID=3461144 RepID=UPI0040438D8B